MVARGPVFKLNFYEKFRAPTIDLIELSLWDKVRPLEPRFSVNESTLSDTGNKVRRRAVLEFERRIMENNTEETF